MNSPFTTVRLLCVLFIVITCHHANAATCTAIASSNWTNTATWSCGHAPGCNDAIVIPAGYTVTISQAIDLTYAGCTGTSITIYGTLFMTGNASQLDLTPSSSISIYSGGRLITDALDNSQKIVIGSGPAEWDSSDGNISGPWIIRNGTSSSTLPVDLASFSASCTEQGVEVEWQTLSETNNASFLLQRSEDAMEWTTRTTIKSQENSLTIHKYHYLDQPTGKQGIVYYRLQQVNTDGSWKLFPAADVNCSASFAPGEMKLYPNPAKSELFIQLSSQTADPAAVLTCTDALNRVVFEWPLEIHEGRNTVSLGLRIPEGLYFLSLRSAAPGIAPQKLIVQD